MREVDDLVRVRWDICEEGKGRREGKEGRAARRVVGESVREISETVRLRFEFICDATMSHLLIG